MQNDSSATPRQGQTQPAQGDTQDQAPRLPHERDESADSQTAAEKSGERIGKIAHDSLQEGQKDTGKSPAMDAAYNKLKAGP